MVYTIIHDFSIKICTFIVVCVSTSAPVVHSAETHPRDGGTTEEEVRETANFPRLP